MRRQPVKLGLHIYCLLMVCLVAGLPARAQDAAASQPQGLARSWAQDLAPASQAQAKPTPDASAQTPESNPSPDDSTGGDLLTLFPHSNTSRYWISGQANFILQWHPAFAAAYSGKNSLRSNAENATSKLYTLYLGYQLTHDTEVFLDMESAGGHGISDALGVAGFTNLDVVRNPDLSQTPYLARFMLRQIIPLSSQRVETERGPFALVTSLPVRRLEFRIGKFSMVDFFDLNSYGSDSHLQFLNWTVDNNGAYDYAANTRGYTDSAMLEYDDHWFTARFAESLMPKVANGIYLDADIARGRAENLEFEARGNLFLHRAGVVRFLSYLNHADMGNYREAIENYEENPTAPPDITATRRQGRKKYGFGLNFEQHLFGPLSAFGRLGWSEIGRAHV